jgi:hypothetical protein
LSFCDLGEVLLPINNFCNLCRLELVENIVVPANPNGPTHKDNDLMMKDTDKDTLKSSRRAKVFVILCHLILKLRVCSLREK